jgi:tetratricopeptide (TPR) repeat protein
MCAIVLAVSPLLAVPVSAKSKRQLEFGVKMALKGSWREAAFRFRKAIEYDPDNPFALNNLGVASENTGRFEEALEAYTQALELAPKNDRILENKRRLEAYIATRSHPGFVASTGADDQPSETVTDTPSDGGDDGS